MKQFLKNIREIDNFYGVREMILVNIPVGVEIQPIKQVFTTVLKENLSVFANYSNRVFFIYIFTCFSKLKEFFKEKNFKLNFYSSIIIVKNTLRFYFAQRNLFIIFLRHHHPFIITFTIYMKIANIYFHFISRSTIP